MSDLLPLAPQIGLSTVTYLVIVTGIGVLFGFALERAGFGSAKNLTAIFILRDFRVFRVMFTAVLTAMLGAHLLHFLGLLNLSLIPSTPNFFWAIALGGLLFGVGFYIGGFCPGTAIVAMARGRLDGLAFLVGIVLGIFVFAEAYELLSSKAWFMAFYAPPDAVASTLYGDGPVWPWILGIAAAAFGGFAATPFIEKRFALGRVPEETATESSSPMIQTERQSSTRRWVLGAAPAAAALAIGAIALAEWRDPYASLDTGRPPRARALADNNRDLFLEPQTLAGWLMESAHREHSGEARLLTVVDLRKASERGAVPIPGALTSSLTGSTIRAQARGVLTKLARGEAPTGAPVVIVSDTDVAERLARELRAYRIHAHALAGGSLGWKNDVLAWDLETAPLSPSARDALGASWEIARSWLSGDGSTLPPRFVFPGAIPPATEVATVVATGTGAGGGCN